MALPVERVVWWEGPVAMLEVGWAEGGTVGGMAGGGARERVE